MRRRTGRPGLVGTMARTAVITGTATAVSGNVQRRQAARAQPSSEPPPQPVPPQPVGPAPASQGPGSDLVQELERLAALKASGILDDAEFAAAKAKLLS